MKKSTRVFAAAFALLMALSLAACGKDEPAPQTGSPAPAVSSSDTDDTAAGIESEPDVEAEPQTDPDTEKTDSADPAPEDNQGDIGEAEAETNNEPAVSSSTDLDEIGEAASTDGEGAFITVSREGIVDNIPVDIVSGQSLDFSIAMDPEYFSHSCYEGVDSFTYDAWDGERSVYYCVYPHYDTTADELADGIIHQYGGNYADCFTEAVTIGNHEALAVYLGDDINAPGYNMHFFIIEQGSDCVIIETQFEFEMYEGLYAIMRECFNTIKLS